LTDGARPTPTALLLQAVERALDGEWQAAHAIVQDHDTDAVAAWIHAVVHRMEGDIERALYWHRRCGRALHARASRQTRSSSRSRPRAQLTDDDASQ